MSTPPNLVKFPVADGAITPPVWESQDVAKNWAAVIYPQAGEEARREFIEWASDNTRYLVDKLAVGEAVEFGADRITDGPKGGKLSKRIKNRWYGVVRAISAQCIEIERYDSAYRAFKETDRARVRVRGEGEPREVLLSRLKHLQAQRKELNVKISEIEKQLAVAQLVDPLPEFDNDGF